jgi:AcrR family transcriptional regulator
MAERAKDIIRSAIELAEKGGFQAVRLRDVAAHSGVALGTLYTRFRSKEDILVAALQEEAVKFESLMLSHPPHGETPLERVTGFFSLATRALFMRPNFARAVLRSVSSGVPEVAEKVLRFHQQMTNLITAALRGLPPEAIHGDDGPSDDENRVGFLLQQIWFATLVGWMGGVQDEDTVVEHMRSAAELLLRGLDED